MTRRSLTRKAIFPSALALEIPSRCRRVPLKVLEQGIDTGLVAVPSIWIPSCR